MIICLCMHVTDREILENLPATFEEIQKKTHVCTGCGCCKEFVEKLIKDKSESLNRESII